MAGREVREYTNLSDPKDKKWGKGKDKIIDDEDITFQRMVAKVSLSLFLLWCRLESIELFGFRLVWFVDMDRVWVWMILTSGKIGTIMDNGTLAFLWWWLNKQMQEVAGERGGYLHGRGALDSDDLLYLKEQMEAEEDAERLLRRTEKRAFAAFKRAASLADSTPAQVPLTLRVEPKPKSGIRQQDLLKKVVGIKPKRPKVSSPGEDIQPSITNPETNSSKQESKEPEAREKCSHSASPIDGTATGDGTGDPAKSLLGLAYESSDSED